MQLPKAVDRRKVVHLAYLDDSDTKSKQRKWQVMSGVIIEDTDFTIAEFAVGFVRGVLISPDKLDQFQEFHACELYGGYGVFEGIEREKRYEAFVIFFRC